MFATLQHIPIAQITGISEKYYAIAKQSEEIWKCQLLSVGVYFSKYENILAYSTISQHWDDISTWFPLSWNTRTYYRFYTANTTAADVLGTQGTRGSYTMALVCYSWNFPVWRPAGLILLGSLGKWHACWCPGSSHHQVISDHDIHIRWVGPCRS